MMWRSRRWASTNGPLSAHPDRAGVRARRWRTVSIMPPPIVRQRASAVVAAANRHAGNAAPSQDSELPAGGREVLCTRPESLSVEATDPIFRSWDAIITA